MEKPEFPIIIIDRSGFEIIEKEADLNKANMLGLINNYHQSYTAYDPNGLEWKVISVEGNFKVNAFKKFLAHTVYNPNVSVRLKWNSGKNYDLNLLKNELKKRVDQDDDIITQFEEADVIKEALEKGDSFENILSTLNKYVFKVNEEALWREQETKNN